MNVLQKLKQSTLVLISVIVVAKLIGMSRDVVLANYFGTSNVSDAYLIAVSVPSLLFYFIGHALSTAYLPMYNKVRHDKGEKEAQKYSSNLICIALLLCTVLVLILLAFPEIVVKLFAAGFDSETVALTARFVREGASSLYFMTIVNIWGSFLQANNNFILPAMVSVPRNLVLIFSIALAAIYNIGYLGVGILAAYVAEFLLLLPFVLKNGFKMRPILQFNSPDIKETLYLVLPIIIGVGVSQINKIIDKSIASTIVSGGISALNYASVINNAVQEVLVTGIITILFARCAAWVAAGKHDIVKNKLSEIIRIILYLLIPASMGIIACAEPLVTCFLLRGEFDVNSVKITSSALCCYTVGLSFLAVRDTLVKVFYAYKDTKITTITSIGAILANIVLNCILSRFWGINGLAIATSIAAVLQCLVLYIVLRYKIGDFGLKPTLITLGKILIAGTAMYIAVSMLYKVLIQNGLSELIGLFLCVSAGVVIYGLCTILLKVSIPLVWLRKIKGRKKE